MNEEHLTHTLQIRFKNALDAWELKQYDRALTLITAIVNEGNAPLDIAITKIKWHLTLQQIDSAVTDAITLWNRTRIDAVGDVLSTVSQYMVAEHQKPTHTDVSNEILNRVCESYLRQLEREEKVYSKIPTEPHTIIIWQCWFQGEEHAPDIVKKCIDSVRTHTSNFKHVIITDANMHEYVTLPDFILEKFNKGIISRTHLSDILRCHLLCSHGGIWIDATTLLSGPLPQQILDADFFVFQHPTKTSISNWFIASKPNHPLITMIRDLLEMYWAVNDSVIHYFIMHGLFQTAVKENATLKELFAQIPYLSNETPHQMQKLLIHRYDAPLIAQIKMATVVHKLTYKDHLHLGPDI